MWEQVHERRGGSMDAVAYAAPVAVILALIGIYTLSPQFYLRYVLELHRRESQAVEIATFICGLFASVMLVAATWRLAGLCRRARRGGRCAVRSGWRGRLDGCGGTLIVAMVAAATIFQAGEEINWGQTYYRMFAEVPAEQPVEQTNLHNRIPISFAGLGAAFLVVMFVGLPVAWRLRGRLPVPRDWAAAVAEGPVTWALLVAYGYAEGKDAYVRLVPDARSRAFYIDFIEQIKEQKELLVSVCLLVYAVYRLAAARRLARMMDLPPRLGPAPTN